MSALILLDLSAAFDSIDHNTLLTRLTSTFGITGPALDLLASYLHDRSQSVSINLHSTAPSSMLTGVPQGSVLGPILFILYTTPLSFLIGQPENHMQPGDIFVNHHLYADDTQLYISFHPPLFSDAQSNLQRKIALISSWMASNLISQSQSG